MENTGDSTLTMPPFHAIGLDEKTSPNEPKEVASSENSPPASTAYEDEDSKLKPDAEHEKVTQDDETISYPGGLKLFVLALVASFLFFHGTSCKDERSFC